MTKEILYQITINIDECLKCHKGKNKSGILYLCENHFDELEKIIIDVTFKWARENK